MTGDLSQTHCGDGLEERLGRLILTKRGGIGSRTGEKMRHLHYLAIRNFKRFGNRTRIELDHPAVLVGPNN